MVASTSAWTGSWDGLSSGGGRRRGKEPQYTRNQTTGWVAYSAQSIAAPPSRLNGDAISSRISAFRYVAAVNKRHVRCRRFSPQRFFPDLTDGSTCERTTAAVAWCGVGMTIEEDDEIIERRTHTRR